MAEEQTVIIEKEEIDDIKGIVALAVLVIYIILAVGVWGFSFSGILVLLSFFIAFFGGIRHKEEEDAHHKQELDPKGLVVFAAWGILFLMWLYSTYAFPDYTSRILFLMFAAAISTSLEVKDMIILLGLSILTAIFFASGVLSVIVLIVVSLFVYAARESVGFGAVMMIPLLLVGWFIGSGWGAIVEQKVSSASTEIGAKTGISTEGVGAKLTSALNDTWLLFTDPNKWYEKQFATKGNRDVGETSSALEITKIEPLPGTVMPKDTFDVIFEMENKGTKNAENVRIGAKADTLADACGKVQGKFCSLDCVEKAGGGFDTSQPFAGCDVSRALGKVPPLDKRFESFSFQAPECPGSYAVSAALAYTYAAEATLNLQMISRSYYEDLLQNKKLKLADELSVASAGPFKVTLRTDRQQPIPDKVAGGADAASQKFKIYLGLVNEHVGTATLHNATLKIPKDFESLEYEIDETTGNEKMEDGKKVRDENCDITLKKDDKGNKISEGEYYVYTVNEPKDGPNADKPRILAQNEWRYYKCGFRLVKGSKVDQIQTFFLRAGINYTFEYTKSTTVSVRAVGSGKVLPKCEESAKAISPISTAQPDPQTKDAILDELAKEIYNCYNKNGRGLYAYDADCKDYKIDIEGCTGASITSGGIYQKLKNTDKYPDYPKALEKPIYIKDEMDKDISTIRASGPDPPAVVVFDDKNIYGINIRYNAPYLFTWGLGENSMTIRYTSKPAPDPSCPPPAAPPAA